MDVLELPRPVINFLRTMSKEMHRYSLCWDIYGGSESVTLTLTWKLNSGSSNNNENEDTADVDENNNINNNNSDTTINATNSDSQINIYNKKNDIQLNIASGFQSDTSRKKMSCTGNAAASICKQSSKGNRQQQFQHGKLDHLANRNIAQMNANNLSRDRIHSQARNLSAESRLKPSNQPIYKYDNNTNNYSVLSAESDDFGGSRVHQSRKSNAQNALSYSTTTNRSSEICPDCPKCCNNANNIMNSTPQEIRGKKQETKLSTLANLNKKVTKIVRGKSLESQDNPTYIGPMDDQQIYQQQQQVGWREPPTAPPPTSTIAKNYQQSKPINSNPYSNYNQQQQQQLRPKYENPNEIKPDKYQQIPVYMQQPQQTQQQQQQQQQQQYIQQQQHQSNRNRANNYQNSYQNDSIPISIQSVKEPIESNLSAYFGSGYIDCENLPQLSNIHISPANTSSNSSNSSQRQQTNNNTNNPWIRRNYCDSQIAQQENSIPSSKPQQQQQQQQQQQDLEQTVMMKKNNNINTKYVNNTSNNNNNSNNSNSCVIQTNEISSAETSNVVCETSLFNRVEKDNVLSIIETSSNRDPSILENVATSSNALNRNNPNFFYGFNTVPNVNSQIIGNNNNSTNPGYSTTNPLGSNTSNSNTNVNNNLNNQQSKVTFDPNLEYI